MTTNYVSSNNYITAAPIASSMFNTMNTYGTHTSTYLTDPPLIEAHHNPYHERVELRLPDGRRISVRTDVMPCYCHAAKEGWRTCPVQEHQEHPPVPQELDRVQIGDQLVVLLSNGQLVHEAVE